jgi:hypothetical protein
MWQLAVLHSLHTSIGLIFDVGGFGQQRTLNGARYNRICISLSNMLLSAAYKKFI